jgi:hypothetical protein
MVRRINFRSPAIRATLAVNNDIPVAANHLGERAQRSAAQKAMR